MVKEIYIEGGGDKKETKKAIRIGFSEFLKDLRQIAQKKRIRWQIIICGSRQKLQILNLTGFFCPWCLSLI
jgi:hypothetical protein